MSTLERFLRLPPQRETRDPKAALTNLQYRSPGSPMVPEWSAEDAFRWAYLSNIIIMRCAQINASTIAALPFRAGPSQKDPMRFNEKAPLAQLLGPPSGGPNPETAADELWEWSIIQREIAGRFGWEIEYAGPVGKSAIVAFWPLMSHRLKAIPTRDRSSRYFQEFLYGAPGNEVSLSYDQVFYDWQPSQLDYRQPESTLQAARYDVSVAVMQDRYDLAFLRNDARPAAIMTIQRFAEADEFQAFKEQVNAEYGGPDNAGKMMIHESDGDENGNVEGALTIQTLGLSQKDAEFIKRHELKFRNLAIAMGTPWSKLDSSARTFDNAGEENKNWWQHKLLPLIRKLQNRVNISLAPRLGSEVGWFDISEVEELQPAPRFTQVSLKEAFEAEIITKNEARSELRLEPLTDEQLAELEEAKPDPPQMVAPPPAPELPPMEEPEPRTIKRIQTRHEVPIDHNLRRRKVWRRVDAQARALENSWQRGFRSLFAKQERETIKRLEGKRGRQMLNQRAPGDQIFDPIFWKEATKEDASRLYEMVFSVGGARVSEYFGLDFDIESPYAQMFIQERSNQLAGQVTDTTYKKIQAQLAEGVGLGEDIPTLSGRIRNVFDDASVNRSLTIARTEVLSAFNASTSLVASQYPADVVGGQEWITEDDARSDEECLALDGLAIPIGEGFGSVAYPPLHPNCRCTIALLTPEEYMAAAGPRAKRRVDVRIANRVIDSLEEAA